MSHRIFISYSSKDTETATAVRDYLESNGLSCWMAPRDIIPGTHYASSILKAIKETELFLLIFSEASDTSEQVLKEVDRAVHFKKPIIPFRIESIMPSEAMQYYLCNTHWLNAYQVGIIEKYFAELFDTCNRLLKTGVITSSGKTVEDMQPPAPENEEISDRLQEIISRMQSAAERDEREGQEFFKRENEEKQIQEAISKKNKEDEKRREFERKAALKKQQEEELRKEQLNENTLEEKKKSYTLHFFIVLTMGLAFYIYREETKEEVSFSKIEDANEYETHSEDKLTYKDLSIKTYTRDELEKYSLNDLKLYSGEIESHGGEMFERVGHDLIEKDYTVIEFHNLLNIKNLINKKELLKKESNPKEINMVFDLPTEGSPENLKEIWLFAYSLQNNWVNKYFSSPKIKRSAPTERDFYLPKRKDIVVRFIFDHESSRDRESYFIFNYSNEDLKNNVLKLFESINSSFKVFPNDKILNSKYENELSIVISSDVFNNETVDQFTQLFFRISQL